MLDKIFKLREHNTTIKTEIIAGITTFVSLAYIIFLMPSMLAEAGGDEPMQNALFIATCLAAFLGTFFMAIIANWPVSQAPGIGACSFFTYTIMLKLGFSYEKALFINLVAGFLFIICSVTGIREKLIKAIPEALKIGMAVGIGIFIAFLGLKNGGLIIPNENTYISFAKFNYQSFDVSSVAACLTFLGLILIGILKKFNIKGSILITIVTISIISGITGVTGDISLNTVTSLDTVFKDFFDISFMASFKGFGEVIRQVNETPAIIFPILIVTFCLFLANLFDSIGTLIAVSTAADLKDKNGEIKNLPKALMCDALATVCGTFVGSPTVTSYLESGVGVSEGGRTGLTALTTSILFLFAILLSPFCNLIPSCATAPALIYVGFLMIYQIKNIITEDITELLPATIAILLIPLTCDIATGMALSFISYVLLKLFTNSFKNISIYVVVVSILFLLYFLVL